MTHLRSSLRAGYSLTYKLTAFLLILLGFFLTLRIGPGSDEKQVLDSITTPNALFGTQQANADAYISTIYFTTNCS